MQPYIRGGVLERFPETIEALGGNWRALLERADVAPEVISIPGTFVPFASYMRLLHLAAEATATPHLGLLIAQRANAETLGTVGIIMTQARTVGAAWESLSHFYRIHDTYGRVNLYHYPDTFMLRYALPRNDLPGTRQVYDVALGVVSNIMRRFCGIDYHAREVVMPYPQPEDTAPFAEVPVGELHFGGEALEMYIPAEAMRMPLPGGSLELRHVLGDYIDRHGVEASTARVVEDMIRRLLPMGECTLERVAATLSVSPRTLQMRLDQEQSSFRGLLESVRREIATFHLRRGDMQLTQLAMVLGYSELSAFSRSFRRWYGMSPRRWSEQGSWQR